MFKPDPSDEGELSTTWEALAPVGKVLEVAFGIPHATWGEEVAAAVLWLLSAEASFVTGSILDVSGGR